MGASAGGLHGCVGAQSAMSASFVGVTVARWKSAIALSVRVGLRFRLVTPWYHDVMAKNLTVRLDDELAADTAALARADGTSINETVKQALKESVERRRKDPAFKRRVRQIIEEDRELLERLAR